MKMRVICTSANFYPRSPCGERLRKKSSIAAVLAFLSTLSLRRATIRAICFMPAGSISIHALLAESDGASSARHTAAPKFLSTLSLRRATLVSLYVCA